MTINEEAKMLLLDRTCSTCKFLQKQILNPSEIEYTQINEYKQKIQPNSLILKFICNMGKKHIIIKDPNTHTCEYWSEMPKDVYPWLIDLIDKHI